MPTAKIATKQAKLTLLQLHAELGGKIKDNKAEGARLAKAMMHVEAVLKLLDPAFSLRPIAVRRRKPNQWFKRGTILRATLDALRKATGPLTTKELSVALLRSRGVAEPTLKQVRSMIGAVHRSLNNHKGKTVAAHGHAPVRWSLLT